MTINWRFALGASLLTMAACGAAWAQTENTLLTFTGANGAGPNTSFIQDAKGILYGATMNGGPYGGGTVYALFRNARGTWKEKVLYSFGASGDGAYPQMPFLAMDIHGALYGTTSNGGAHGVGTVFKLKRGKPQWTEQILYNFTGGSDGDLPVGGVSIDANGNLYGTTRSGGGSQYCGGSGCGVVYELKRGRQGTYTQSVLHTFTGIPQNYTCYTVYDGQDSYRSPVTLDSAGNLYGTTVGGGMACEQPGSVWELSPAGGGNWTYSLLYVNAGGANSMSGPIAGVVLDNQGNLYGTAQIIGTGQPDGVFELVKDQGYQLQVLYQSTNGGLYDTVTRDSAGNLYWTSQAGGGMGYLGTVEELTSDGTHSTLYAFPQGGQEGTQPLAGVMVDGSGNLFGTASTNGGSQGNQDGTAWEITP